jgi:hypothetical protein
MIFDNMPEREDVAYFKYLTNNSKLSVTFAVNGLIFLVVGLRFYVRQTEGITPLIMTARLLALISLLGYIVTLYREKQHNKTSLFSLQFWGNFLSLQRGLVGGMFIYHAMSHREDALISSDAVLEFVFTLGINVIYPVHSSWTVAVVLLAETTALCLGAIGSPFDTFFHIFVLCVVVACVTFVTEGHQVDSYKSHRDKEQLLVQLMRKNQEMTCLIGNVAHDLKVSSGHYICLLVHVYLFIIYYNFLLVVYICKILF